MVGTSTRRGGSQSSSRNKSECRTCKKNTTEAEWVQCDRCEAWCHLLCSNLPKDVFPFLQGSQPLAYFCADCVEKKNEVFEKKEETRKEIETVVSEVLKQQMTNIQQLAKPTQEPRPAAPSPLGIRIRNLPEQRGTMIEQLESDKTEIECILAHLNINAQVTDARRIGKLNKERTRPLMFDVASTWDKRLILASAAKLKTFNKQIFLSREPNAEELLSERQALKKRYDMIQAGKDSKTLRIRNFKLFELQHSSDQPPEWKEL